MPVPSRALPRVGAPARIAHFGGGYEQVVIATVTDEGRRVQVKSEDGSSIEFALSPATARFVAVEGGSGGPRLELLDGR
jgi:hypothetical protein